MYSKEAIYKGQTGLYAGEIKKLMEEMKKYNCKNVWLEKNGKRASLTALLALMSLGVWNGDKIVFSAEAPQEELAVEGLCKYVEILQALYFEVF